MNENSKIYFYISIAALVLAVISFGLAFSPLGIYALIASVLFCLCSLSFLATQKKKNCFKGVKAMTVAAYVVLAVCAGWFVGGLVFNAIVKK